MSSSLPLLFAIGLQEVFALIFVMVSIIGWVIKTVQGNNQQLPPPVQRPGKRREERTSDDLDAFLQQVNRPPEQRRGKETGRAGNNRSRQPATGGQSGGGQRSPGKTGASQQPTRRLVDDSVARREAAGIGASGSGGLAQNVRERTADRVGQESKRDVGQDIRESVLHNMGSGLLAPVETGSGVRKTATQLFAKEPASSAECSAAIRTDALRKMLSNPDSIRQAIVIQEILNRPKCLR